MRYMAKVLKAALWKKFPLAPEKDVLKVCILFNLAFLFFSLIIVLALFRYTLIEFISIQLMSPN